MKRKALIVATAASAIDQFCKNNIKVLKEQGFDISVYANFSELDNNTSKKRLSEFKKELLDNNVKVYDSKMRREIKKIKENLIAYIDLKKIININKYDIIHCNTPIASFLTRIAARNTREKGTIVIYTAHGFHFYKGAPIKNWLLYFPCEFFCSFFTDILITINKEDYFIAKKMRSKSVICLPGIGIDIENIRNIPAERIKYRQELKIKDDAIIVLSVGEINGNKNHETILRAISLLNDKNIYYIIVGKNRLGSHLNKLSAKLGVEKQLIMTGYRQDVIKICKASDIFAFPSKREGLPIASLEAMISGLPVIASDVRGISDYSQEGITGFYYKPNDIVGFSNGIKKLIKDSDLRKKIGQNNSRSQLLEKFDNKNIKNCLRLIYNCDKDTVVAENF